MNTRDRAAGSRRANRNRLINETQIAVRKRGTGLATRIVREPMRDVIAPLSRKRSRLLWSV